MTNIDLIEQLNNEIESVELPSKVLDNLLLEMQRQKINSKATAKKPRFKLTARFRNSLAVCSLALIMVIAIPIIGDSQQNKPTIPTPQVASFQRLMPNIVEFNDVDAYMKTNIALPMTFAKTHENTTTIFETEGVVSLVKQFYLLSDSTQVTIDIDLSNTNQGTDENSKVFEYNGIDFSLVSNVKNSGCIKFDFNNSIYFVSFQNLNDNTILTEIIDDILNDK